MVAALGVESGISKSEVSRVCSQLYVEVDAWRTRSLAEQTTPYVFLDATYCRSRVNGRVVLRAAVIATGVTADGHREVLGASVGDLETEQFWAEFLRGLRDRGLHGVQLVVSDTHRGLVAAAAQAISGAAWQRCLVHHAHALAKVTRGHAEMVATAIRTIFVQPTGPLVRDHVDVIADLLAPQFPPSPTCCATPRPTSPRPPTSPKFTGARSGPPTRSSG